MEELLEAFMDLFVELLPALMGPHRDQLEPVWTEAGELWGSLACNRGLAAGEAVEEAQLAREAILRLLYQDPPRSVRPGPLGLREVLRLNRAMDLLVTHTSVGHTDALFFALFQGSGVPERISDELRYEMRAQLEALRASLYETVGA